MKPLSVNVLIAPALGDAGVGSAMHAAYEYERREGSTLVLPSAKNKVQSKPSEGIVRAIGPEVTLTIAEGDRVLYRAWTGIEIQINGVDHQLTPQRDVLAIVDPGENVEVIERPIAAPPQQQRRAG